MSGRNSKLRYALDKEKGRNIRLEKQKKHEKEVAKRRQAREKASLKNGHVAKEVGKVKGVDEDETSEVEEDELVAASDLEAEEDDISQDGDRWTDEDEDDENDEDIKKLLPNLKKFNRVNGVASAEAAVAAKLPVQDEEDDDDDSEAEPHDIPLSDLSDVSDSEDITPHQRLTINNTAALNRALESIRLPLSDLPFSTHQSVTSAEPIQIPDTNDDLKREQALYEQCLHAVQRGRKLLLAEGAPFTRPNDYFAEMVKTDEHMGKVKGKLVSDAASRKASEDAKKQRQLKKYGKVVQQEKLKERAREKRETLDKMSALKRKRRDTGGLGGQAQGEEEMFDVAVEGAAEADREKKRMKRDVRGGKGGASSLNRQNRDAKFGFGGKKRFAKSNDATSTGDMRGYSAKKMKAAGSKSKGAKRLGKSRRQNAR